MLYNKIISSYLATKAQNHKGTQMKFKSLSDREEYIATQVVDAAYLMWRSLKMESID